MPQLNLASYPSQIFWLVICFFTMYSIMSFFIIPRIKGIMDLRQRNIDKHLLEAHQFKEKAETALKAYQNALKKATDKASQSLERTQAELNEFIARRQSELTESLNQKIANGEAEIKKSKEEALTKVREISEDLALDIIKKIGIKEISAKDIENTSRTIMKEN